MNVKLSANANLLLELSGLQSRLEKRISLSLSVHGISHSEFQVLHHLYHATQQTQSRVALAAAVHLTASGVTRLLNPMEKLHMVEKQSNKRDARVSLVHLTSAGAEMYRNAASTYSQLADGLDSEFSEQQFLAIRQLLHKLV